MIPFRYAPMAEFGASVKRYPDEFHPVPEADLVLGKPESRLFHSHRQPDQYGQILYHHGGHGSIDEGGLWSPGRYLYELRNVVVVRDAIGPNTWLIMLGDGIAAEESCPFPRQLLGRPGMMAPYAVEFRERIPAVFDAHPWETNHYHRVMDSIPRRWAWDEGLIPKHAIKIHRHMNAVHYDTLYFPSFWPPLGYAPGPVEYVRSKHPKLHKNRCDPLYFSRADARTRRVLNEAELPVKRSSICCGADLSFDGQIKMAQAAKIIIGPHGAAMVNSVFADHATVIEFVPRSYQHPCIQYVSKWAGNRYVRLICDDTGPPHHDMAVNLDHFRQALDFAMEKA